MSPDIVGGRVPIIDGAEKVTGAAKFTGDLRLPGMLHGKVLRSPHAHARILNINAKRALSLPGVKAVVTIDDSKRIPYNSTGVPGRKLVEDQFILSDKARFVGDPVAAVAATDKDVAREALDLIEVEYEPLPFVLDAETALSELAPEVHEGTGNVAFTVTMSDGDIEEGFRQADHVFEDTYRTSKPYQCSLEPCGVSIAHFDSSGRLTVWTSTQMPFVIRGLLSKTLGLPMAKVRVIKPYVGGGFGSRLGTTNELICALLAQKSGRPVKLEYTREESFLGSEPRHPVKMELRTGVKRDGTITAREMKAYVDTGAYATHGPAITTILGRWFRSIYKCPHMKYEGITVYTNTVPAGGFRGYGNPQATFAVECQADRISRELGLDPLEFRLKNHYCEGDKWAFTGYEVESCGFEECVKHIRARIGEESGGCEKVAVSSPGNVDRVQDVPEEDRETPPSVRKAVAGCKRRGIGLAMMMHVSGGRPVLHEVSSAVVKLNEDGTASIRFGSPDIGQGSSTSLMQIAAETLGLELDSLTFSFETDTDEDPYDAGSHASRQAYSGGYAVKVACERARDKLLCVASKMMDVPVERLRISKGIVYDAVNPERRITMSEVSRTALMEGEQIIGTSSAEPPGGPPVSGIQLAEVEVDTVTGEVNVLRLVAAHDVGKAINPMIVEGQIEGSLVQGLGYALMEDLVIDRKTGRPFNTSFLDYKLPTIKDVPEVEVVIVEAPSKTGAFGAKSIGEGALVPTAAAIANAVYDAVGVRVNELPITPERVLEKLKETDVKVSAK